VVGPDWSGESRNAFHSALADARGVFDAADQRLAANLPKHRARTEKSFRGRGLTWDTPEESVNRRVALEATGGEAPNFITPEFVIPWTRGDG
jgi:hypothetical protein